MNHSTDKCDACTRVIATHAAGCSRAECPQRKPQMWGGPEGTHGFPGLLAEDRMLLRRLEERSRAVDVDIADL